MNNITTLLLGSILGASLMAMIGFHVFDWHTTDATKEYRSNQNEATNIHALTSVCIGQSWNDVVHTPTTYVF